MPSRTGGYGVTIKMRTEASAIEAGRDSHRQPFVERALDFVDDRVPAVVVEYVLPATTRERARGVGLLAHEAQALREFLAVGEREPAVGAVDVPRHDITC